MLWQEIIKYTYFICVELSYLFYLWIIHHHSAAFYSKIRCGHSYVIISCFNWLQIVDIPTVLHLTANVSERQSDSEKKSSKQQKSKHYFPLWFLSEQIVRKVQVILLTSSRGKSICSQIVIWFCNMTVLYVAPPFFCEFGQVILSNIVEFQVHSFEKLLVSTFLFQNVKKCLKWRLFPGH